MLNRWDPFSELNRLQEQMFRRGDVEGARVELRPAVDIREEENAFVVDVEVPGVSREDLNVELDRGTLTVRGERKFASDETTKKSYRRVERYYGAFARSFSLPDNVDADNIAADLHDGILELRIPKKAQSGARKVEVRAG